MWTIPYICLAAIILIVYAPYLLAILAGKAEKLESYIEHEFVMMIIDMQDEMPLSLQIIITTAVATEVLYFFFAWMTFDYMLAFRLLTLALTSFEAYHILRTIFMMRKFFSNRAPLGAVFRWKLERAAALLLCSHATVGILLLVLP
ncbi:MAG: hypothetical protein ACM3PP_05460 [Candidatus Saccharibacteria bacterium]